MLDRHTCTVSALILAVITYSATADAIEIPIGKPTVGAHRVDICLEWGSGCDGEAAEAFCKAKGYTRAVDWAIEHDIGATQSTMVIGSGQVCAEAFCDGYLSVTCAVEDDWTQSTGHAGLLVEVILTDKQSPEGLLAVAVSESDPRVVASATVDAMGLALVHAAPGKWRVYLLNYKNAYPIEPPPAAAVDIPAKPTGNFVTFEP